MQIYKEFFFEAAHFLPSAPKGHPNARIHGHSFRCRVTIDGAPDLETGLVVHFETVQEACNGVRDELDHHYLNEIGDLPFPTLEHLCIWIWGRLSGKFEGLAEVSISRDSCMEGCIYKGPT